MKPNREELERAIAYWEEFEREIDEMPTSEILEAQREPVRTALAVLRDALDREANEPTCDGCVHVRNFEMPYSVCNHCRRKEERTDRYEPKGDSA